MADHKGNVLTQWWNSGRGEAAYIDFTKTAVANWFYNHLKTLQNTSGVDSYKFDAGETSWSPPDPVLNATAKEMPSKITSAYTRTVARFGSLVEVRSGHATQDLPIFMRMIDKDTEWTVNNGLPSLITTLLQVWWLFTSTDDVGDFDFFFLSQLNLAGYVLVLPDMIGGNGYDNIKPDKEIFVRWLQANTFMPSLQFSFVPWDYDAEVCNLNFPSLFTSYQVVLQRRIAVFMTQYQRIISFLCHP